MIREERFLISRKPFAVDPATVTAELRQVGDRTTIYGTASAVWYRRQDGVTRACIGSLGLWAFRLDTPVDTTDPIAVLSADLDGRYGGTCEGRWDGSRYWGAQEPEVMAQHMEVLRPMLDGYPMIPAGFDGWWTFQAAKEAAR